MPDDLSSVLHLFHPLHSASRWLAPRTVSMNWRSGVDVGVFVKIFLWSVTGSLSPAALFLFHSVMESHVSGRHFNLGTGMRRGEGEGGIWGTLPGPSTPHQSWSRAGTHHHRGLSYEEVSLCSPEPAWWLHHLFFAARDIVERTPFRLPSAHSS